MNSLRNAIAAVGLIAIPVASFAQSNGTTTRAQVRAELVQLQSVGYNPAFENVTYPNGLEAAEARLRARSSAGSQGGSQAGSMQAGSRAISRSDTNTMYAHH